jgi:preprotein translocase subunit SecY
LSSDIIVVWKKNSSVQIDRSMLVFFILSLLVLLIINVVILPGLMQQSSEVMEEVAGMWHLPSMFGALSALFLLLLVCIPAGPLTALKNSY